MMKLARPNEVAGLRAIGFQEEGPSEAMPGFIVMRLAPPEPPPEMDDEIIQLAEAVACMEGAS